jgi:hypothetical protein
VSLVNVIDKGLITLVFIEDLYGATFGPLLLIKRYKLGRYKVVIFEAFCPVL